MYCFTDEGVWATYADVTSTPVEVTGCVADGAAWVIQRLDAWVWNMFFNQMIETREIAC
jgi:hypothetical protein